MLAAIFVLGAILFISLMSKLTALNSKKIRHEPTGFVGDFLFKLGHLN